MNIMVPMKLRLILARTSERNHKKNSMVKTCSSESKLQDGLTSGKLSLRVLQKVLELIPSENVPSQISHGAKCHTKQHATWTT